MDRLEYGNLGIYTVPITLYFLYSLLIQDIITFPNLEGPQFGTYVYHNDISTIKCDHKI